MTTLRLSDSEANTGRLLFATPRHSAGARVDENGGYVMIEIQEQNPGCIQREAVSSPSFFPCDAHVAGRLLSRRDSRDKFRADSSGVE